MKKEDKFGGWLVVGGLMLIFVVDDDDWKIWRTHIFFLNCQKKKNGHSASQRFNVVLGGREGGWLW